DRNRRPAVLLQDAEVQAPEPPPLPAETREAMAALALRLPPKERAALLLKDVFDFSLEETAACLQASTGAVKAALHRAREKLSQPAPEIPATIPPRLEEALLDAWCEAFNARDLQRLADLMLED